LLTKEPTMQPADWSSGQKIQDPSQVTHYSQEIQTDDFLAVRSALHIVQLMLMTTHSTG